MIDEHKRANEQYFRKVLSLVAENGVYTYPHIAEAYTVRGGVFYGTKNGVKRMREVTPKGFHKHIKLKGKKND
jgi:hypothetical protein